MFLHTYINYLELCAACARAPEDFLLPDDQDDDRFAIVTESESDSSDGVNCSPWAINLPETADEDELPMELYRLDDDDVEVVSQPEMASPDDQPPSMHTTSAAAAAVSCGPGAAAQGFFTSTVFGPASSADTATSSAAPYEAGSPRSPEAPGSPQLTSSSPSTSQSTPSAASAPDTSDAATRAPGSALDMLPLLDLIMEEGTPAAAAQLVQPRGARQCDWGPYNKWDRTFTAREGRIPSVQEAKGWYDRLGHLLKHNGDGSKPTFQQLKEHRGRFRRDTDKTREYSRQRRAQKAAQQVL